MALDPKLRNAVKQLQSEAQQWRAVLIVADAVGSIEDLERLAGEADAALVSKRGDLEKIESEIAQAKKRLTKAEEEARKPVQDASDVLDKARADAEQILAKARSDAASVTKKAQDAADKAKSEADGRLRKVETEIEDRLASLDTIEARITSAKAATADLEGRAKQAREFLSKLKV